MMMHKELNDNQDLDAVEQWITNQIAKALKLAPEKIDKNIPLQAFGFDSLHMQSFFAEIEKAFQIKLDEELILDQENIKEFAVLVHSFISPGQLLPENLPGEIATDITKAKEQSYTQFTDFTQYKPYQELKKMQKALGNSIFFDRQEGVSTNTCLIEGKEYDNFTGFDYLGLSTHPEVVGSALLAMKRYGTSVSASRLVSGEKVVHQQLESEISSLLGTEDAMVFNSGHGTNLNTIAHLYGPDDLILHDELAHNSLILGAQFSGATRLAFPHNNYQYVDKLLQQTRHLYQRVLIIIEGVYSMDGDFPELPDFVRIKAKHAAWIMVDEAHSIGVLGEHGGGIREQFGLDAQSVDIWMGTLSKTFSSCGGYIAGKKELVEYLKYTCPGFVFSVGLPPVMAGAALAAVQVLKKEPERVYKLRKLCASAREIALGYDFDVGLNNSTPILPIIIGDSKRCICLSEKCFANGINIKPIIHPAVPENSSRLRIVVTAAHSENQIEKALTFLNNLRKSK